MIKIFTQDHAYRGMIVVVALTETAARELMAEAPNYDETKQVVEHEMVEGFMFFNMGDM